MKNVTKILLTGCLLASLSVVHPAQAQEVSMSIAPAVQELVVQPGHSVNLSYSLVNLGDPQLVSVKVVSIQPQADGTVQIKDTITNPLTFSVEGLGVGLNEPFFLKSQDKRSFTLAVEVPDGILEKDYYMSLVVQSQAPPTSEGTITARTQLVVSSNVLLSVTSDGSLETKPRVIAFQTLSGTHMNIFGQAITLVRSGEKVPFILELSNQGRHLIKAQGVVTINGAGPKKNLTIQPQTILASSESIVPIQGLSPKPNYSVNLPGFFFGLYTISARVTFGPSSPIVFATTHVLALPSLPVLIFIAVIIGFLFAWKFYDKNKT